jgi:hypothetical protein
MKITAEQLNHRGLMSALDKLEVCTRYPTTRVAWNIMKLSKALKAAIQEKREFYQKMVKEHALLDEHGALVVKENGIEFKSPEDEKAHATKFEEFMKLEIEIPGDKLSIDDINLAGLAPIEVDSLSFMINDIN